MMFYMNSKVLEKYFLDNEDDQDILDSQYVLVSSRIRISDEEAFDNIISARYELYPSIEVCTAMDEYTFRTLYFEQLEENKTLLAYLVKTSIEDELNIIFLCSAKESKIKYLKYLAEFVMMEFGYPIYDYKKYAKFETSDYHYDKSKVIKICDGIIEESKNESLEYLSDHDIHKDIKSLSKDSLKKELKRRNLYRKGMTKQMMRDILEIDT